MGLRADKRRDRKGNKRREVWASGQTKDETRKGNKRRAVWARGQTTDEAKKAIREGQFGPGGRQKTRQKRQ